MMMPSMSGQVLRNTKSGTMRFILLVAMMGRRACGQRVKDVVALARPGICREAHGAKRTADWTITAHLSAL